MGRILAVTARPPGGRSSPLAHLAVLDCFASFRRSQRRILLMWTCSQTRITSVDDSSNKPSRHTANTQERFARSAHRVTRLFSRVGWAHGFYHPSLCPADLPHLYRVCLLTGDSGADASGLYQDPDLLGHFYAAPYAVYEPDLTSVLTDAEGVGGYVVGCRDSLEFAAWMQAEWLPPLRQNYPLPTADDTTKDAAMIRLIHKCYLPSSWASQYPAHLHIDLLPKARGHGLGRQPMGVLLDRLRTRGVTSVHLGEGRPKADAVAFYQQVGFIQLQEFPWGY